MKTEAEVYKAMRRKLPEVHWVRIEAWVGAGVPDINGAFLWPANGQQRGFEMWCELKVCKTKAYKTEGLWRPAQIAFQTKRSFVSDAIWNLVSHPRAGVIRIYSGDKVLGLSTDLTGSIEPDLVLEADGPWSTFLDLAASRQIRPMDSTDSTDSIDPTGPAGDPLGR